jgi:protocatechuate 3,4-dioxygenase beta subunit
VAAADLTATPEETGGPFPADGSNDNGAGGTADVLHDPRALRSDIRSDVDGSNAQVGVPFTLDVAVRQLADGAASGGAAVYVWHCNQDGQYSAYNSNMLGADLSARSFLRGVQVADANGSVRFTTVLPGRYQGRAFHIHFAVFSDATFANRLLTSQMAMDDALADQIFADAGYSEALRNDTDNSRDNVFSDGVEHQLLSVSGDVNAGYVATFTAVV